ncbi:MAG: tyrosine-type recombinase/integrase [Gemmatimonadales bacterium]
MDKPLPIFTSILGPLFQDFLLDKRSRGFRYTREAYHLLQLDRFLETAGLNQVALPAPLLEQWLAKTTHRKPSTHRHRLIVARQFAAFLQLRGYPAHHPMLPWTPKKETHSASRIFSRKEIGAILAAADQLPFNHLTPLRHLVVPELFRVLYGCGLRVGEACRLTVADVDLNAAVLTVRQGKFRRDRLVPFAPSLQRRLMQYTNALGPRAPTEPFFPTPRGKHYGNHGIYDIFRQLLVHACIVHGGRGRGPRLHEIRHSFAVHRLEQWYRAGADLNARLPLLSVYLGHQSMVGTQAYLQLTQTIFTDLASHLDAAYGCVIPGENTP